MTVIPTRPLEQSEFSQSCTSGPGLKVVAYRSRAKEGEGTSQLDSANHCGAVALVCRSSKCFGKSVSGHVCSTKVRDGDSTELNELSCVVVSEVDMFGRGSVHRVVGHCNSALAIAKQIDRLHKLFEAEKNKDLFEPLSLTTSLGSSTVLRVVGRCSNQRVKFGVPRDECSE